MIVQIPDAVNGAFEFLGGASVWMHVRTIMCDKQSRGVSPFATAFFTLWGFWNLYYYPSLAQWASFAGGEADKDRAHEAEQNELDRKHKEKLAAAST